MHAMFSIMGFGTDQYFFLLIPFGSLYLLSRMILRFLEAVIDHMYQLYHLIDSPCVIDIKCDSNTMANHI